MKQGLALLTMIVLLAIAGAGGYFVLLVRQAEDQMGTLEDRIKDSMMPPSVIMSSDGKLLYQIAKENRVQVKFSDVPLHVRNAILAAEDRRFYDHTGFDPVGLARAVVKAVRDKRVSQGGSTLTMQLAKLLYSGSEATIERKLQDIAIASAMEKQLSKDQILLLYLNYVYFGESAHGIGAASQIYFNKKVQDLNLAEAAILARCVRRPSVDNPFYGQTPHQEKNRLPSDRSMNNKEVVLNTMREEAMITEEAYKKALTAAPKLNPNPPRTTASLLRAPYFVHHVLAVLKKDMPDLDLKAGGYRVETTLNTELQALAEKEVRRVVQANRRLGITTGAFVAMDSEGRILCEVGGVDFNRNQFNAVSQGIRQPGSAFKPFVYAAALASGALGFGDYVSNAARTYWDEGAKKEYKPRNLGGSRFGSRVSLENALKFSINRAAVNTLADTGAQTVAGYARDAFGFPAGRFTGVGPWSYSLALGTWPVSPLEMMEGYSVFMLAGDRVKPRPITRVIGADGNLIKSYDTVRYTHVLDGSVVNEIDNALRETVEGGTGRLANVVPNARGKTGTTQDGKDAWFCGYTDGLVGIGWVASEHREGNRWVYKPSQHLYGGTVTIQIWAGIMKEAHKRFGHQLPPSVRDPEVDIEMAREQQRERVAAMDRERSSNPRPRPIEESPPAPLEPVVDAPPIPEPEPEPVINEPRRDPPRRSPPRRQEPESELVEVEICADSGMRAGLYCPETVPRLFARGQEPRRRCTVHRGGGGGF